MELGSFEEEGHRKVGCRAADIVDLLIVIGERARFIAEEAAACGLDVAKIMELDDNQAAVNVLEEILKPDNIVLIKGSNSQRMNEIVTGLSSNGDLIGTQKDFRNKK